MAKARYFTKLNIIAVFNKLRIAKGEEQKTAFRTRYSLYESLIMNFGLTGAPGSFQEYINNALLEYLDRFYTVYLDDVLIYSNTKKEYTRHVRLVLEKLRAAGLQVDIAKCEFSIPKVKYLGLLIGIDGVEIDLKKVSIVNEQTVSRNLKDVQSFLGFANFYRRFIRGFSRLAKPLTALTRKDYPFEQLPPCQVAFDALKEVFYLALILILQNPDRESIVEVDTSNFITGRYLSQYDDTRFLRPVAYFLAKMTDAECNYEIYDKELLVIIKAFELQRPKLEGTEQTIQVYTDYKSLEYFITNKLLNRRQARQAEFLSRFNFKIIYRLGPQNTRVDTLTRRSGDLPTEGDSRRQQ